LDFGQQQQQQVSYVRFLSVVSRRYANAVVSGQVEPDGAMRLSGEAVKERIRRVLRASSNQGMDLRKAFELFDKNGDGLVSARELQKSARLLGVNLSDAETQAVVHYLDRNGHHKGQIEYEELFQFAQSGSTKLDIKLDDVEDKIRTVVHDLASSSSGDFDLKKAFAAFDANGDGKISRHEFRDALRKMKIPIRPVEFSALARRYDKTGSGHIDYQEFVSRVKYTHADLDAIAAKLRKRILDDTKRGISHWEQFQSLDANKDGDGLRYGCH
jgi:Ca2+-binding EF-hand superfamily protein